MTDSLSSRRQFLGLLGRGAGLVAVGGLTWRLVAGRDGQKVWQLDPTVCDGCKALNKDFTGASRCSTECVLKVSAVKVVNNFRDTRFPQCGYCRLCPAYYDVSSPVAKTPAEDGGDPLPTGLVCPYDAIVRKQTTFGNPNNNYFEYTIDESKCTGCGKCVVQCASPTGNGSLRLEIRHNLCVECNQCAIARACPAAQPPSSEYRGAFYRDRAVNKWPGKTRPPGQPPQSGVQDKALADRPCGPGPFASQPREEDA